MKKLLFAILSATLTLTAPLVSAAAYMKLGDIKGDVSEPGYEGFIEIESFAWGLSNTGTQSSPNGGGGTGKAVFQDMTFSTRVGKSSPALMLTCATGQHIREVVLQVCRAGETEPYLTITLENVMISSWSTSASESGDRPTESLSINFTKISFKYTPYDSEPVSASVERPLQ